MSVFHEFYFKSLFNNLRKFIGKHWDEATAYPNSGGAKGAPEGQCYVTARLLKDIFGGRVMIGSVGNFKNHCWLEHYDFFLDLTAEQQGINAREIIFGVYDNWPQYKVDRELTDAEAKASRSHAFDRYLLLKKRVLGG